MAQLRRDYQAFVQRGYQVTTVGHGTPARAEKYRTDQQLPFPVLGDWEKVAYHAYGLERAPLSSLVNPKLFAGGLRAIRAGALPGKPEGDTAQLPGTFIIDRDGIVRLSRPGAVASDIASTRDLLAWIDRNG